MKLEYYSFSLEIKGFRTCYPNMWPAEACVSHGLCGRKITLIWLPGDTENSRMVQQKGDYGRGEVQIYIAITVGGVHLTWQMGSQQDPITGELRLGLFDIFPTFFSLG